MYEHNGYHPLEISILSLMNGEMPNFARYDVLSSPHEKAANRDPISSFHLYAPACMIDAWPLSIKSAEPQPGPVFEDVIADILWADVFTVVLADT